MKFNEFRFFTNIKSIGSNIFNDCSRLLEITLPNSVLSFESIAFSNSGIKSITIPINTQTIKQYSFAGMRKCETIVCMPMTAPSVSGNPWTWGSAANSIGYDKRNAGTNRVYIPNGSTGYNASGWQTLTGSNYGFTFVEME